MKDTKIYSMKEIRHAFKVGDRVYHKNLNKCGTFDGYDDLDTNTCRVIFDVDVPSYRYGRKVITNQLVLESFMKKQFVEKDIV